MRYKLSDLFELQMGKTPSRNNPNYWNSNDYSWVSISDMSSYDKYVSGTKEYISERAVKESGIKTIPANTVIMSFKLSIGKTAITTGPIFSNEAIMAFIDKKTTAIDPEYIFYLFSGKDWDEGSNKAVMGKTLNKATLSNIEVDIPSLDIQKERIEKLNKISILIADKKQQLNQLDELIKARFVEMFGNDKYKTRTIKDVLCESFWLMPATPKYIEKGIPYITSKNIKNRILDLNDTKYISEDDYLRISKNRPVKPGDILVSMIGTLGQTAVVPKDKRFYGQNVYLLRLNGDIVNTPFFCEFFNSDDVQYKLTGKSNQSTQAYLKANHVEELSIPIPPIAIQNEFANLVAQVDKSKFAVQKSLEKTQQLFDSLMQEYFG